MSRLTTAQVINLGEYLESDFDPVSLTNPQLLGILGYHNINYPTPYTKPKLVQIFNDEIKAKAAKLKKERLKKENSLASDEGIIDGHSGLPLNGGPKVKLTHSASGVIWLIRPYRLWSQRGLLVVSLAPHSKRRKRRPCRFV